MAANMASVWSSSVFAQGDAASSSVLSKLTEAEKEWLAAHPVIRVGPDPDFPPYESIDEDGKHIGMAADYLKILEKELGIRFEVVSLKTWAEVLEHAKNRDLDLVTAVETPQRSEYLSFTSPYISLPSVILATTDSSEDLTLESLAGKRVVIVQGYFLHDLISNSHPDINLVSAPDIPTAMRMTSFGKVDAMINDLATTTHFIRKEGLTNLRVAGDPGYPYNLSLATRKDWPELNSILEKALGAITDKQRTEIQDRWIQVQQKPLWQRPVFWYWVIGISLAICLIIGAILTWNRVLKRVVAERTKELKTELDWRKQAEEELRQHRDHLDDLVKVRTAELSEANERMRNDLEAAARVQLSLLPQSAPEVPGTHFVWHYRPCDELAGDILNVFQLDKNHVGVYVADVSGHGVAASLLSVAISRAMTPDSARSSLLVRPAENGNDIQLTSPDEVARQLNKRFPMEETGEKYFTLLYGILNTETLELRYVSAGHPPIVRCSVDKDPETLPCEGMPIGWYEDAEYEEETCQLKRGDRLCLYSDGVPEAMNGDLEQFGDNRLIRSISGSRTDSLDKCVKDVVLNIEQWCGESGPLDDISILAMEIS